MEWIVSDDSLFILPSWVKQEEAEIKYDYNILEYNIIINMIIIF